MKTLWKKVGSISSAVVVISSGINAFTMQTVTAQSSLLAQNKPAAIISNDQLERFVNEGVIQTAPAPKDSEFKAKVKTRGEKALKRALRYIGVQENPPGSNCQPFSRYFGMPCVPWCALFVSKNFDLNGDKKLPWTNVAAVSSILEWGQRTGNISRTPRKGYVFILKGNGQSHTGIVRSVNGNQYTTVEGNYDNSVRSVTRKITPITYFVRVP
jgi:hypothetical protein